MESPLDDRFDGTWRFANENDEEGWNYIHFSNGNRVVQFYNINGGKFEKGQCLVGKVGDDQMKFTPQGGGEGWTRNFSFDEEGNLTIIEGMDTYPCSRLPENLDWLERAIRESENFFDENEPSWQD